MNDEIAAMVAAAARLPAAERRELIEAIADTLADEACEPLSPEWKAELDRRVAESDAGIGENVQSLACSVALAEDWDRKFEADIREGRLDGLAAEAIEDLREGRCTDLPGQPKSPLRDDTTEPT